jgi:predicted DNA binding CopG/RHH family protein
MNKRKEDSTTIGVRIKRRDKERLKEKADKVGLDVSTYIRYIALESLND